ILRDELWAVTTMHAALFALGSTGKRAADKHSASLWWDGISLWMKQSHASSMVPLTDDWKAVVANGDYYARKAFQSYCLVYMDIALNRITKNYEREVVSNKGIKAKC
ncbi:unnamed protein product, partial [Sphagnum jensenii]